MIHLLGAPSVAAVVTEQEDRRRDLMGCCSTYLGSSGCAPKCAGIAVTSEGLDSSLEIPESKPINHFAHVLLN